MEENKTSIGSIISVIIIIAIIVLGGLYFWGKRIEESKKIQDITTDGVEPTLIDETARETASIKNTSTSDDLNAIEKDLNDTNTVNLDGELNVQAQ